MLALGFYYIRWHYTYGVADLINVVYNFIWFFNEFFSIPLLIKTLFLPFNRLEDDKKKGFDPAAWAQKLLIDTLMRFVGAVIRIFIIILGVIMEVFTIAFGLTLLFVWLCAPLFIALLIGFGFTFIAVGT